MNVPDHERWWTERGQRELRELLFREWDPIGLGELTGEWPEDEYEAYAGQIARRLRAGSSEDELAALLESFRLDMGLEPATDDSRAVAGKLKAWYARSRG
jgi:hypothetical protein